MTTQSDIKFMPLDPENAHSCNYCQRAVYDIATRSYRCPERGITMTKLQYAAPNDCQQWHSAWENNFKQQQATGKG